jgi:cell envelope opacity-associated protein A
MVAWPKPVQKPHPPIHVRGAFPHGARRAIQAHARFTTPHGAIAARGFPLCHRRRLLEANVLLEDRNEPNAADQEQADRPNEVEVKPAQREEPQSKPVVDDQRDQSARPHHRERMYDRYQQRRH